MTIKPKRAAIYARVSTQDQNPDMQLRELRSYAQARDLEITHEFVDKESGAKEDRPQLEQLLSVARGREIDTVLVWKFDRFARSTKQLVNALEEFQHLGVDFISKTEQIDTSSPTGKVLFTMVSAFAEFERSLISERIRAGIARSRAEGKPHGRSPIPKTKQAVIKKLRKQGLSYRDIVKETGVPYSTVKAYASPK
jgi:DNA invertase Pin-like site-specific DNA recombinase